MRRISIILVAALATLALTAGPSAADDHDARIHLIHGIPDVDVDVIVAGDAVIEGFSFSDTQDLSSFAGQTLTGLQVRVAGTDTVAIDAGDVALPATGNYTVFAHLDADGTPSVAVFANDTSTIAEGNGRLVVRHAAAAPEVDVKANGSVAFAGVANGAEGSADLPVGTVSAEVVPAGADEPVVIGPADLPVNEGTMLIVYATGSLDDGLQVLTESITDLGPTPSAVHTGDSPVGSNLGLWLMLIALATVSAATITTVTTTVKGYAHRGAR